MLIAGEHESERLSTRNDMTHLKNKHNSVKLLTSGISTLYVERCPALYIANFKPLRHTQSHVQNLP